MKISEKSLELAKNHIKNYYDSDFFVKPFEFEAIWSNWIEVKNHLTNTTIEDFKISHPIYYPAQKSNNGFRIVHQLDPIDTLIYTSLAFEVAEQVERKRVQPSEKVVCSYRINVEDNGNFFSSGNGYKDFKEKSLELANESEYVLLTDITDFYNQIYQHRVQNAIEACDGENLSKISRGIELFLMSLTNKTSRGIPVGPAASIIFAEATLIDVDNFILSKGLNYVRYVDDIRIFANSKEKLKRMIHDLTDYLYDNHRLSLSTQKTKIISSNDFSKKIVSNEEVEKDAIHKSLEKLNIKVDGAYPFIEEFNPKEAKQAHKAKAQSNAFETLMDNIIQFDKLDLGLSRHILRRAKRLKTRSILVSLLDNIDFFAPVIRDVILYLNSVTSKKMIEYNIDRFKEIIEHSEIIQYPYVKYWFSYYFANNAKLFSRYEFAKEFINLSEIRFQALYARKIEDISWVKQYKNRIDHLGPWDKRAVLYAAEVLSKGERTPWMNHIMKSDDIVEKSMAIFVKGKSN